MGLATLGARLRNRFTKVGSANYDAGNTSTIKLPQGTLHRTLWVRLVGSLNISGALTNLSNAPLGLISKLEVIGDGRTIWAGDPRDLYEAARFLTSKTPELVAPSGTGATVATTAAIPIFWEAIRRVAPQDSLFWSEPYGQLELKITWASAASAIYSAGTASVNATTRADVHLEDTYIGHDQVSLLRTITFIEKTVTAAQSEFEIPLPKAGLLDWMLIRADVDGAFSDALINTVRFQFDSSFEPIKNVNWADLQNWGVNRYQIDGGATGTGRVAGIAFVDLIENGMISSAPNLKAMTDPKLICDVALPAGTTRKIRITMGIFDVLASAVDNAA